MERRQFVMSGIGIAAAGVTGIGWPAAFAFVTRCDAASHPTLAVFDSTLAPSADFARRMRAASIPSFDAADDIGRLWHTTLAPRLADAQPVIVIGVTRASDCFVLQRLAGAPRFALRPRHDAQHDGRGPADIAAFLLRRI